MTGQVLQAIEADGPTLRRLFGCFPSSVVAVCAMVGGAPAGLAASTFVPVSLDPPLVAFCVQRSSRTWPLLREARRLGISAFTDAQDVAARQLAGPGDRFAGLAVTATPLGAVLLDESAAALECALVAEHSAGDHTIAVLRVHRQWSEPSATPLIFHGSGFHRLHQPVRQG